MHSQNNAEHSQDQKSGRQRRKCEHHTVAHEPPIAHIEIMFAQDDEPENRGQRPAQRQIGAQIDTDQKRILQTASMRREIGGQLCREKTRGQIIDQVAQQGEAEPRGQHGRAPMTKRQDQVSQMPDDARLLDG